MDAVTTLAINTVDPLDLSFWALVLDASEAAVLGTVEKVGVQVCDVSQYLRIPPSRQSSQV
ncbi:MAG TPA: hypothetical protein VM512_12790 [Burkholderiaceae bacterium]|nr:hypothetical protein [Burkholderiaceae bacterium]